MKKIKSIEGFWVTFSSALLMAIYIMVITYTFLKDDNINMTDVIGGIAAIIFCISVAMIPRTMYIADASLNGDKEHVRGQIIDIIMREYKVNRPPKVRPKI